MKTWLRIARHVLRDILRSRILLAFTAVMFIAAFGIFSLETSAEKAVFGLINLVLFLVPLFASLFTSIYVYNNVEFVQLVLSQPVKRSQLFGGIASGIGTALIIASSGTLAGALLMYGAPASGWLLVGMSAALALVFTALALGISITFRDKARGLGTVLLTWLVLTLVYDGLMLLVVLWYADYPLETATLVMITLNPIDISRILLLMQFDQSALLGFTGVFFTRFFGDGPGFAAGTAALLVWIAAPAALALRRFNRTDW
jgi:Cu-processing system permease protein